MNSGTVKGYIYALVATIAFSNIYIFSKAALNEIHLVQFGIYWFAIGFLLNFGLLIVSKKLNWFLTISRSDFYILLFLGVLEIITTTSFFLAINIIPDPSITSFLGNMYPVMLILMGVTILKERFGPVETFGVVLAISGAFVISYQGGDSLQNLFIPGTGVILINAFFAAFTSIVVKKNINRFDPKILNFNRTFWLLLFAASVFIFSGKPLSIPFSALKNIAVGATLGPFLSLLTVYLSFKYIEASRSSIVQSLKGIFVLAGAFIYLGTIPSGYQLTGGFITVFGVIIMALAQAGILRIRKSESRN